jgi:Zn-dependent protease
MRDPSSWSFPIGRLFGIAIRIHILFPVVAVAIILRAAFQKDVIPGSWIDVSMVVGLLFVSVLLHEFGHCFGARLVDGDAREVLMWPLGGLAYVEVPHTPRANFITTAAGPLTNLLLCLLTVPLFLWATHGEVRPTWNPFWYPFRDPTSMGMNGSIRLYLWNGDPWFTNDLGVLLLARFFWVNLLLFLLNMVLVGFPMDAGRLLQCILWPRWGYRQATMASVYMGFFTALVLGVLAIAFNELLPICLGYFIYASSRQQGIILETGGEESVLGYDFSQGYTSLERDQPPPPRKRRPNFWQRWLQRRAARKLQRELEQREAEERRMDELLEKIQREGKQALTDEENRFLKRVADKYRNRQ